MPTTVPTGCESRRKAGVAIAIKMKIRKINVARQAGFPNWVGVVGLSRDRGTQVNGAAVPLLAMDARSSKPGEALLPTNQHRDFFLFLAA